MKIGYIEITKDSWNAYKFISPIEKIRWDVVSDIEYAKDMLKVNGISNLNIKAWKSIDNNSVTCREIFDVQRIPAIFIRVY